MAGIEGELDQSLGVGIGRSILPPAHGRACRLNQYGISSNRSDRMDRAFCRNYDFQTNHAANMRSLKLRRVRGNFLVD